MTNEFRATQYLLEGMLDGGLPFVASYLERKIGRSVIITDAVGKINYPDMSDISFKAEDLFIDIPQEFSHNYYYNPANNCLYYRIKHNSHGGYVIVENLPPNTTAKATAAIAECELALKYHFSLESKKKEEFGQSLWEHLFLAAGENIIDKLKLLEQKMDINNYYFVSVIEVEEGAPNLNWNLLRSYLNENLHRDHTEYVSTIIAPGRLVTILRGNPKGGPMDIDPDWAGRETAAETKFSIENKFNITFSQGLGRLYRPSGLTKSYREACIALALPRLMGKKRFTQYFSQLGVFTVIFSHDIDTIKTYCLQVLGKIIEHDEKHGTDLLRTLRILLDNACSWTTTANQLYVHVNTVYYRASKIEQLLNVDFSSFETRLHFYTAIRTWDILHMCNLLE
ncbi:MAG: helix-turn-helix domain-containing protein [Syntrophomonadaceae bacterium]|nr:helix-turn-helix domain-containing protein [Syntrophomonadaceae bacterium]